MKPAPFTYHRPETAAEAVGLLADLGDGAKLLAGGQSLVPMLNLRLAVFDDLVDVSRIDELSGIERREGHLWIGAGTTEAAVERSAEVAAAVPLLARATPLIGHRQIRNRGTIGGSLAHADPAAEYPAVVLALDAELEAVSPRGARTIAAADFFTGFWSTALDEDELLTGIRLPVRGGAATRCGFGVREIARRHGDFAIAGAAVALEVDGDDRVVRAAIGLFGLGSVPLRASAAEAAATGRALAEIDADDVGRVAVADLSDVPSDLHGSAAYRTKVGAVMVARAWADAAAEATVGATAGATNG
ncbi:MAG: xanthine dehydrogenase family protein subunit M [Acidimicrobiales bacterium]|nr:xanthine dehydrogenase family protein subunit M [Acidimicrobiales bacterium]